VIAKVGWVGWQLGLATLVLTELIGGVDNRASAQVTADPSVGTSVTPTALP